MNAGILEDLWLDMLLSSLRGRIRTFGELIGKGSFDLPDVLADLMNGPVLQACRSHPELYDEWDTIEAEVEAELFAVSNALEQAEYRSWIATQPGSHVGLPAYFPAPTEPRDAVLARQTTVIQRAIAQIARSGAARRELARRQAEELPYLDDPTPANKAKLTRSLHREVAAEYGYGQRIPSARRLLVTGAQGTGKTTTTLQTVAGIRERIAVVWTEPTIAKADEVACDYVMDASPDSLPAMVVRGRGQQDPARPPGVFMCQRHEVARRVAERGLSVRKALCEDCPLQVGCGYLDQAARIEAMAGVGVFFQAHAGRFTISSVPAADLFIGDERIDPCHVKEVALAVLAPDLVAYQGGTNLASVIAARRTIEAVAAALAQPHQLAALRAAGVGRDTIRDLIRLLEPLATPVAPGIWGSLSDAAVKAELEAMPHNDAADALLLLRAVIREIDRPRPMLNGLVVDGAGIATVCRLRKVRDIANAGVLLLDGTGDIELNRAPFGARLEHEAFRIERDADVTGTRGKSYSRQSITALDLRGHPMPNREAGAKRLRGEIATIARRLPGPCLVVAPQAAETAMADNLRDGIQTAHYGALRGLNTWERCQSAVSVGQTSMSVRDLEALARCYMADDDEPFVSSDVPMPDDWPYLDRGWPYYASRMRRMRDGRLEPVEVAVHPDPRCQRVLEQVREAEIVQGVDRTRAVFNRRQFVMMTNLVLDLTYDRVLNHAELVAGGSRWERAWAALGVIPLGKRDLHVLHPAVFSSQSVAKDVLDDAELSGGDFQTKVQFENPPHLFAYRRQGQRGSLSRVLIDMQRHPDPRTALTDLLGPLVWFEPIAAPQPVHKKEPAVNAPMPKLTADYLDELFRRIATPWPAKAPMPDVLPASKLDRWELMPLAAPICQAVPAMAGGG